MDLIQKTVFISYRRTNVSWAIAIQQYLTHRGYDVFFDFLSINSGDFEKIIPANIKARAHFLVLLVPSALDRCNDPKDWLRREIEIALDTKRNIIPILLDNFDFGAPETKKYLTRKLESLGKYSGLNIYGEYFEAGMEKLCNRFLNVPLDKVDHPVLNPISSEIQQIVDKQKKAVAKKAPVEKKTLSAQEWFERAYKATVPEEAIRLYTRAIELDPKFSLAYNNRGCSYDDLKQHEQAIKDYDRAIKLDPKDTDFYFNRGGSNYELKQYEQAIKDFDQAIKLNPEDADYYIVRGSSYAKLKQYERSIEDFDQAIKLNPEDAASYNNRGNSYCQLKKYTQAIEDLDQAIKLKPDMGEIYYSKACYYAIQGLVEETIRWLRQALNKNPKYFCELTRQDSDFDRIRDEKMFQKLLEEFCETH